MSWMEKLYQTYEAAILLDLPIEQRLMPISHTNQNAHINIVINGEGNFKRATVLEKTQIVLPATEQSAGRTGTKPPPHPLADKLQYVAKDYSEFITYKPSFFEEYYKLLKSWCDSKFSHPKANAVLEYVKKGRVISDLVENKILFLDQEKKYLLRQWTSDSSDEMPLIFKVLPKEKKQVDQGAALVCWSVEIENQPDSDTWKDISLQNSWNTFISANEGVGGLCFVTGNFTALASNHPAKIRHTGDKAKLISFNDFNGFTVLGKFTDTKESFKKNGSQSVGVGLLTTQKAHNALRWLISRQGYRNGDQVYVAWAVSGKPIPEPLADTWSFLNTGDFDLEEVDQAEAPEQTDDTVDHSIDLGQSYAQQLSKKMAGYRAELTANEQIVVMGIDSATPGRMGILYYRELFRDDFFNRLESWHTEFSWPQRHTLEIPNDTGRKPKTKVIWPVSSPVPIAIAKAAYGEKVTDNLKKKVIERLVPCIVDGQPFPWDLVDNCIRKATNRNAYASDGQWLWEKNLAIACALFKGYYRRHPNSNQRRNYAMALEENNRSRDYLYGRLLAIAERIEEVALNVGGENRSTTAARLMQRFADRPYETWRSIELALQPYIQRLRVSRAGFLTNRQKELDAVIALFNGEDFRSKAPLSGEFLLAYHCQRQKFKTKTDTHEPNETEAQGDSE
ncbi:type I-C CRISPR-associated protein Cas8c/Csd1 [Methylotuvimicrobium alcaliphilum]|uniref:CRISPR-associated protein, Csd1 family n=1 Tax=Methylotuvimicrobium alcaliphilum (strain DSM 19304 / NCIMB 14124 / VKM B-2133 / 20Z) TaxID=1091494 RepID=G4ST93_META2|nr:type I-C CRISPR-associated protein Cas8c/Csd1 [Methylotuvimicrobium alcaliphilum]CCE23846.1 CRISPR-associated protein, Csd1 family [Methylotuvimicrobium alcaliphilum 20Z]